MADSGSRRARSRRRASTRALVRRWLAAAAVVVVAVLYVQPVRSYLETRSTLAERAREVRALEARQQALQRLLAAQTSDAALLREARRLGYVKPGERLFIVKGIPAWRHARALERARADDAG
jgi:cell division protein FtsB